MARVWFLLGSLSALTAVALGAFGAHGLRSRVGSDLLGVFEVGVRYHMYHALALLATAWAAGRRGGRATDVAGWCFVIGTLLFSGSLYLIVLTERRALGTITPIGGVAFLVGWAALAWTSWTTGPGHAGT